MTIDVIIPSGREIHGSSRPLLLTGGWISPNAYTPPFAFSRPCVSDVGLRRLSQVPLT